MDRYWKRTIRVRVFRWYFPITVSWFEIPYSCNESGLWPFNVWFRCWRVSFHWRTVADAYIQIGW